MIGIDDGRFGTANRWVVDDGRAGDSGAAAHQPGVDLFCFPHAGGGPSFFRPWRAALAPEVAVHRILLPGREGRLEEPPFRHITELAGPLCAALEPHLDRPYALFGHSMGAVVAYEVARWFSRPGRTAPACLIVSGRRAPGLGTDRRRLSDLPDGEFLAEVGRLNGIPPEVLGEPELLDMLLPALRADFELAETYQPLPGGGLDCPVTAYLSTGDPEVDDAGVLPWQEVTAGKFAMRVFRGDHFYLKAGRPDVLDAIRADVLPERSARVTHPAVAS
ncbi:MAG TPA: alpha/beta fold hydrolase [Streptosporangiaceae bacterium]|nr:alpha/beta fold hydrolase [Streptosporangiaceae bacterium]